MWKTFLNESLVLFIKVKRIECSACGGRSSRGVLCCLGFLPLFNTHHGSAAGGAGGCDGQLQGRGCSTSHRHPHSAGDSFQCLFFEESWLDFT